MNYADSNFFVPAYLNIRHETVVVELLQRIRAGTLPLLPITWLVRLEVINAIELTQFLGKSGAHPHITPEQASLAIALFEDDLAANELIRPISIDIAKVETVFEDLSLRHTAKHGFRTYDLLHVASALTLNCREFWSFDARASKLAKLEGLKVLSV